MQATQATQAMKDREVDQLCINTIRTLVNGRGTAGQLGSPGSADGAGAGGLLSVAALLAL